MTASVRAGGTSVGTGQASTGTTLVVNKPTGAANGDLVCVATWSRNGVAGGYTTVPSGFVLVAEIPTLSVGWMGLYAKVMSSDPANWTWTGGGSSGRQTGVSFIVDGADTSSLAAMDDVIGAVATGIDLGTTWSVTVPQVDPVAANDLLIAIVGNNTNSGFAKLSNTPPGSMTLVGEAQTSVGTAESTLTVAAQQLASGALTGTRVFTQAGELNSAQGFLIALKSVTNVAPTAGAGTDQTGVAPGATVNLSGTDSDSDGTIASRLWAQVSGPAVTLSGSTTANATFTAPSGPASTLVFSYTVTDNLGATGTDSVSIGVVAANVAPTVGAGVDQTGIEPWGTVTLTGTDSDSDGTIASRLWTQTAGSPTVTLSGSTTATATFEAPGTIAGTTLTFRYEATDDDAATSFDLMTVTVMQATEKAPVGGVLVAVHPQS